MGLIFLSAMTTAIAHTCREEGLDAREALGSSLLTTALSTFVVGALVVLTGILHISDEVLSQVLPECRAGDAYSNIMCSVPT